MIVTVCDAAAGEVCPLWPGSRSPRIGASKTSGVSGHGAEAQHAKFREVALILRRRIEQFLRVPLATLDRRTMQAKLQEIGQEA